MKYGVELLISTMNRKNNEWLKELNIKTNVVVVNQCGIEKKKEIQNIENYRVLWKNSKEKGLSKSRNCAIDLSEANFLVLCDDDEEMLDDYEKTIMEAFLSKPDADIIAFQVKGIERPFKKYSKRVKRIGYLSSLHISSVEIVIKRESIVRSKIRFNERFGSGAQYKMGEENIFLYDCLKNNLHIYYVPSTIANLHMGDSTWFSGFTSEYFYNRGAVYRELFGKALGRIMLIVFALKNYKRYRTEKSLMSAIAIMNTGYNEYSSTLKD